MLWNIVIGLGFALCLALLHFIGTGLYNIFFHPLRSFPGPASWKFSRIPYVASIIRGTLPYDIARLHRRYGPVVRVAPNELAAAYPAAWREVMGGGAGDLAKWKPVFQVNDIVRPTINSIVDKAQHRSLHRAMAPAFSDQALREQHGAVLRSVRLLVKRLRQAAAASGDDESVNLVDWYKFTAFDIIGDLAFGEPFGNLEKSDFHPWVRSITQMGKGQAIFASLNMFPRVQTVLGFVFHRALAGRYRLHMDIVAEMIRPRTEKGEARADLMQPILDKREEWGMDMDDLVTHAGVFVGAGSMTVTIVLSSVTYFLLTNPKALSRATREVRSEFDSDEEINPDTVGRLRYIIACLDEAMRLVPPVGTGLPRITEAGVTAICGALVPPETVITIQPYALYHDPKCFKDADEFHPERFLGDKKFAADRIESVKPFHTGTRDCLGRNLGTLEIRLVLARLLFNFDMRLAEASRNWLQELKVYRMVYQETPLRVALIPRPRQSGGA